MEKVIKLNTLTSFRFIAALLVFLFHASVWSNYQTGYLGVSFFFILSGFILAYNYSVRLKQLDSHEIKKFYCARIAKIYPIHLLTFFFAVPYYFFIPLKHDPVLYVFQSITNIFLLQSFIPFGNVSFNGVSWSLSNEIFFYLMFPIIISLTLKYLWEIKWKIYLIGSLWLIFIFCFANLPSNNELTTWFTYYFPITRIFEFFVGVTLGLIFLEKRDFLIKKSHLFLSFLEVLSIILLIFVIIISPYFPQSLRYSLLYIPFLSFLIFIFSLQKGIISNVFSRKIFVYLGEISFSFYMVHNLVLSYIYFLWKPNISESLTIIICFIISLICSSLLYRFYEEPMRIKMKQFLNQKFIENNEKIFSKKKII
ncbi:acyltransferase family protein [Metabacillus herbersteinensis]|uniref:Acyltransferase family protein n=1 Tax=Metabacillus herbersteinensis TaxID=283816 RepID=A0ABV6G8I3_9BACI